MGERGEYWETGSGNLVDPREVPEVSKSREFQQPSQQDVGQGSGDSTSPSADAHAMDGSAGNQPQAGSDVNAVDPGDGSQQADSKEHSMDGAEAASNDAKDENRDQSESGSSRG